MHENTLDNMAVISLGDLGEAFSDLSVGVTGLDHTVAEITHSGNAAHQIVLRIKGKNGLYNLSLLLFSHGFIGNHDGVGSKSDVTINVTTEINLNDITSLKSDRLIRERRVVTNNIVDRDAGRESNTLFNTLVLEDTFALLLNKEITEGAGVRNKLSSYTLQVNS